MDPSNDAQSYATFFLPLFRDLNQTCPLLKKKLERKIKNHSKIEQLKHNKARFCFKNRTLKIPAFPAKAASFIQFRAYYISFVSILANEKMLFQLFSRFQHSSSVFVFKISSYRVFRAFRNGIKQRCAAASSGTNSPLLGLLF